MEKIATENLFLLEFVVDRVYIYPNALPDEITKVSADTCVSFSFLDNEPLDICEEDFTPKLNYTDETGTMRNGKSVLFSLTPTQIEEACVKFDVTVNVFQKMKNGVLPDKIQVGSSIVPIVELFNEMLVLLQSPDPPTTIGRTLKDSYKINNLNGDVIGNLSVFIRISCYGKLIVTQFQMNLDEKSVFFKDREGRSLYKYKKASKTDANKPSSSQETKTCTKLIPTDTYAGFDGRCQECHYPSENEEYDSEISSMGPYRPPPLNDKGCYQEIGAAMNGNSLTIRVHKDQTVKRLDAGENGSYYSSDAEKLDKQSYNPCGCGALPERESPRRSKVDPCYCLKKSAPKPPCMDKQFLSLKSVDDPNNPFSFKVSGCPNNVKNNITVVSPTSTRADGMQMTEISDPDKDVFVLRIGKKCEGNDKKSNLELELVTPKGIDRKPIPKKVTRETQYSESDAGPAGGGGGGKGGKGGKKGKGGKGKKGDGESISHSEDLAKKPSKDQSRPSKGSTAEKFIPIEKDIGENKNRGSKTDKALKIKPERDGKKYGEGDASIKQEPPKPITSKPSTVKSSQKPDTQKPKPIQKDSSKPTVKTIVSKTIKQKSAPNEQLQKGFQRSGKDKDKNYGFGGGYIMPDLPPKKVKPKQDTSCKCWRITFSDKSIAEKYNRTCAICNRKEIKEYESTLPYCTPTVWEVPSYTQLCCSMGRIKSAQAYCYPQPVRCGYKCY